MVKSNYPEWSFLRDATLENDRIVHKHHSVFSFYFCTNIAHKMMVVERVGRGGKGGQVVVMHVHCGSSLLPAAPPPMQPSRQPDTSSWTHTHSTPPPACLACLRFFVPWLVRLVGREGRCPASGFPTSSLCTRSLLDRVLLWPGSDPPCTPATVQHMLFWCFSSNHFLPFENPCNFYSQVHVVSGPI